MILDSSALLAIFCKEPGYPLLLTKVTAAQWLAIGAPTLVESAILLSARIKSDAHALLVRFLQETHVAVIPFSDQHIALAQGAWLHYGKGRHPAALNLGDCLAYAVAKQADMPLLCT